MGPKYLPAGLKYFKQCYESHLVAFVYLFKVNNGNTRTACKSVQILKQRHRSNVIDVVLVSLLLTLKLKRLP